MMPLETYGCADLDVELAHWVAVVHGVECRHFVDTHWRHLEYPRNFVHDADAAEAVLALSEVEERHDGGLLVLGGVARHNLFDELLILRREFERDLGVVLGRVAMLQTVSVVERCSVRNKVTYDIERAALIPRGARDAESPPLSPLELPRGAWGNSACEGYQS